MAIAPPPRPASRRRAVARRGWAPGLDACSTSILGADRAADGRATYVVTSPGTANDSPDAPAHRTIRATPPEPATRPDGKRAAGTAAPEEPSLRGAVEALRQVLDVPNHQLGELTTDELRTHIRLLHEVESMTAAAMSFAVGALARAGGVAEDGASSTTAWVADTTGRTRTEASRVTRLGASLGDMPATAAALARGTISTAAADTIVRAVADGRLGPPDEVEDLLLPLATEGPERLRGHVRRLTQQVDGAAMLRDEQRQHQQRSLSLSTRDDGMMGVNGQLAPEAGNKLRTLLEAVLERDPAGTSDDDRRRPDQRLADALETVVDLALGLGDLPATGGVARPHVSVLVDLATFDADLADPADPQRPVRPDDPAWSTLSGAATEWAGTLSPQTAVKLCCDAGVSRVVMAGPSQVLDVGRETRNWSASQRRAVNARDRCCRGPGCGRPIGWTQIHHLRWWRRGGSTSVDNGLALCSTCHDLIHHRGWHAELDAATAAVTWTSPDRRRTVVTHPRPPT